MKIVHLNTYDGNGGAGRACLRLNAALNAHAADRKAAFVQSKVLAYFKFGKDEEVGTFTASPLSRARAAAQILAERYLSKSLSRSIKTPFSLQWFGQSVIDHPEVRSADIIHLHWINHGFLTPRFIAQLARLEKPIVWTFHDSNAFTGGCHVRYDCEHYLRSCGHCPILRFSGAKDQSHSTWLRKQRAYAKLDFRIIAPSKWMHDSVRLSSLLGARQTSVIPNTLETQVFRPYVQQEAKSILNIPPEKFVLMSGFMPSKNDKHKGTPYLVDALRDLAARPEIDPSQFELVIFGNKNNADLPEFPFHTTFLGTVNNDVHLAKCYSAADAFISPSLEDNLPNTVMESLSCGTPVIAFTTGGIPDMVTHGENGYLAPYRSSSGLADGLEWLYLHPDRQAIRKEARRSVLSRFSEAIIAARHLELYESLVNLRQR
ncbi:glycosyl transferase family 1 [Pedobacter yulinensis]|uniref:Glycosyl transferase family 1 n=1 Tax=Pedobacter yulinensis TaxID=2126353 RepID=A0A2T3HPW1_9SPHI|nr:glycosyltransferase [Pedobacter yulinensis]PST84505.1 glycosyl transferase family 1 [Pedobacter yulinensis]